MTDDDVLLHAFEEVLTGIDGSLGEHFGGLLEGGSRDEALGLQRGAGDTLEDLLGGGRTSVADGDELLVLTAQDGVLYNLATAIVVIVSLLLSVVLGSSAIRVIYYTMMKDYPGWLTFYLAPWGFPLLIGIGIICFVLVTLILNKKIKKIPLSQALKNME